MIMGAPLAGLFGGVRAKPRTGTSGPAGGCSCIYTSAAVAMAVGGKIVLRTHILLSVRRSPEMGNAVRVREVMMPRPCPAPQSVLNRLASSPVEEGVSVKMLPEAVISLIASTLSIPNPWMPLNALDAPPRKAPIMPTALELGKTALVSVYA